MPIMMTMFYDDLKGKDELAWSFWLDIQLVERIDFVAKDSNVLGYAMYVDLIFMMT